MHTLWVFLQTAYIDVCDDTSYAVRAKSFCEDAIAANIPAITTAGIYPGVSNGLYHCAMFLLFFFICTLA